MLPMAIMPRTIMEMFMVESMVEMVTVVEITIMVVQMAMAIRKATAELR